MIGKFMLCLQLRGEHETRNLQSLLLLEQLVGKVLPKLVLPSEKMVVESGPLSANP